jgi:acyl-CoA thioesterase FadM
MYVIVRLLWTLLVSWRKPKVDLLAAVDSKLIVLPNDLDFNFHLNNGRYLTLMDVGRFDLTVRTGLARIMFKEGWYPVLGGAAIQFRRSLSLFQRFTIRTRVVYWDSKWIYLEQNFLVDESVYASAAVRAVFRKAGKTLNTNDLIAAMYKPGESPPPVPAVDQLSPIVRQLLQAT